MNNNNSDVVTLKSLADSIKYKSAISYQYIKNALTAYVPPIKI